MTGRGGKRRSARGVNGCVGSDEKEKEKGIDSDEADDITEAKRGEEKAGCTWQERRVDMTWT